MGEDARRLLELAKEEIKEMPLSPAEKEETLREVARELGVELTEEDIKEVTSE